MNREDVLAHLRTVEKAAYPRHYREMQGVWTWNDLTSYCEGEPFVRTWDGGYVLWTSDAIVDLASTTHVSLATFRGIIRDMAVTCGGVVEANCRAGTSYRLVHAAQKLGFVEILRERPYDWAGETFYDIRLRFTSYARK